MKTVGLHQHIGSGWLEEEVEIFLGTVGKTLDIAAKIMSAIGHELEFIDFGGGPGIPYKPGRPKFPMEKYASGICEKIKKSGLKFMTIAVEPGRFIVGDTGILLTRINTVEEKGVDIVGVDSGFNTLVRPALYDSYHHFVICSKAAKEPSGEWLIAGNLCESTDVFNQKKQFRPLASPEEGDVLALLSAGAYGFAMASRYNGRGLPAEVMIRNGEAKLIRERDSIDDYMKGQLAW